MPFVQMNTDEMMVPVLIPRTADPVVTGINSNWLIAGAGALAVLLAKPKLKSKGPAAKKIKIGR
jgi:hypothetical protein